MNKNANPPKRNLRQEGNHEELLAEDFLREKGFTILKRNFHFGKTGEIDLIAEFHGTLIFVEVKARRSKRFGLPESAITPRKQATIRRAAEGYLYTHNITNKECRFDVVAIQFYNPHSYEIRHLENAF